MYIRVKREMFQFIIISALAVFATALPTYEIQDPRIDVNADWRVVGGSAAPAGAYPFVVSLRSSANSHFCGGTILNSVNILTAAHCVVGRSTANTVAVAGTNTLNAGGVRRGSSRIIIHAGYNAATTANDVAVVRLSQALSFTNLISQVSLNTANTGAVASILMGWGRLSTNGGIPNNLQHLNTQTITHAQCQASWGSRVTTSQICSFTSAGQGACMGDSGGPLIQSSNRAQLGIVSFGVACAQGFPDVYARVSSFISWINSAVVA